MRVGINFSVVTAILLCAAVPVAGLAEPIATRHQSVSMWLGWRGLSHEGRSPGALPLTWDAQKGILWRVPIPGSGHSSPIADADRIYVSTAYADGVGMLPMLLDGAIVGLATLLPILAAQRVLALAGSSTLSSSALLIRAAANIAIALTLFVVAWLGEGLFDFPRCDIRGWLASSCVVTLSLGLAIESGKSRIGRLLGAAAAAAFAITVAFGVPSRDHAFRGGVLALNAQVVFAISALPLFLGLITGWAGVSMRQSRRLGVLLALASGAAAAALLRHLLVFRNDSLLEVTYLPTIPEWLVVASAPAAVACWVAHQSARTRARTMATSTAIAVLAFIAVLGVVEQVAMRSNYVAYHIGVPRYLVRFGGALGLTTAIGVIIAHGLAATTGLIGGRWRKRRRRMMPESSMPACALLLGALFFVRVNYVHAESQLVRAVIAVDRGSGELQWKVEGLAGPREAVDGRNSPATPTPVSDGERVCAYFGNPGVMCIDRNGRLLWSRTDIGYTGFYGVGFSPIISDGLLVLASDTPSGIAIVHALDVQSGNLVWRKIFTTTPSISGNNRTPIVKIIAGEAVVILWGRDYLKGFRLRTGDEVWHHAVQPGGDLVSGLVSDDARLYLADVTGTVAVDTTALAEGREPLKWRSPARANCASPVLCRDLLFTVTDVGIVTAIHAQSGRTVWRHRLSGFYFASPVASSAAAYITNSEGLTTIIACDSTPRILAVNDLQEPVFASLAALGDTIYVRTARQLYAIR